MSKNFEAKITIPKELMSSLNSADDMFFNAMEDVSNAYSDFAEDYVPYKTGRLSKSKSKQSSMNGKDYQSVITWDAYDGKHWYAECANYPFRKDGSPKIYNTSVHGKAQGYWERNAYKDFEPKVKEIIEKSIGSWF